MAPALHGFLYSRVPSGESHSIVVLTPFLPWPLASGGQVRQYHLLDVARRRANVTLICDSSGWGTPGERSELAARWPDVTLFPAPDDPAGDIEDPIVRQARNAGRAGLRRLRARFDPRRSEVRGWRHPLVARALAEALASSPDLLQVEFLQAARYVPPGTTSRVVLVAHDVVSRRDRRARRVRGARRYVALGGVRAERHERAALRRAELVITTSEEDAAEALRLGARRVSVVPNGADDALVDIPAGGPADHLLFVGAALHSPNVDAVAWWGKHMADAGGLPPLSVVGAGWDLLPTVAGVRYMGFVPDLRDLLASSIVVAPLRVGGGTKLKIVEAMAAGRPIVATPIAVEGLPVRNGVEALVEQSPDGIARAVRLVLGDGDLRHRLGTAARAAARELLWSNVEKRMDAVYDELLGHR